MRLANESHQRTVTELCCYLSRMPCRALEGSVRLGSHSEELALSTRAALPRTADTRAISEEVSIGPTAEVAESEAD
jgi:hypothetical protein